MMSGEENQRNGNGNQNATATGDNGQQLTRQEYERRLRAWLDDARLWHEYCLTYPRFTSANLQIVNENRNINRPELWNNVFTPRDRPPTVNQFVIPPLWKRAAAEALDFLILLVIKMVFTFTLIESFFLIYENYQLDVLKAKLQDPNVAMQLSVELLTLEIMHRFLACFYEIYFLRGGFCATPGKRYMGIMVVRAENIIPAPGHGDDVVRVINLQPLGIQKAILRSVIKNVLIGIMLPMFTFYIFRFNRTGYDMISNSLVVEYTPDHEFQQVQ